MGQRSRTVAERRAIVNVLVETRVKNKRRGTFVARLGALLGSKSLAVRGVRMLVVEYRVDRGPWTLVPKNEVLRVLSGATR